MIRQARPASARSLARRLRRDAAGLGSLALLVAIVVATIVAPGGDDPAIGPDVEEAGAGMAAALEALPANAAVLVGFDADIGSYPEIVHPTREVLVELMTSGHRLSVVSFTPEGRALAIEEVARLRSSGTRGADDLTELGYRAGSEAALARSVGELQVAAYDAVLIIGGSDIGPRSWVEQVQPRLDAPESVPMLAIAPAAQMPELDPYRRSGQLRAAVTNAREGLAIGSALGPAGGSGDVADEGPSRLAILLGMLAALAVLAVALLTRASEQLGITILRGRG